MSANNNHSKRGQQAKSAVGRHVSSTQSDFYRYDARITSEDYEDENLYVDNELEYEDDGDFLDSQGIQPEPEPKVVRKPYRKRIPNSQPRQRSAPPTTQNLPKKKIRPNRRPMDWQDDELFDEYGEELEQFDDPVFDEIEVYDEQDDGFEVHVYEPIPRQSAGYAQPQRQYVPSTFRRPQPVQIIFTLVGIMIVGLLLMSRPLTAGLIDRMARTDSGAKAGTGFAVNNIPASEPNNFVSSSQLSPFFSRSVLYWEADIVRWANRHNLDPNMVATIMQIESCGDPSAVSSAGAMGLFQVMPFHFQAGEDGFDPDTNALRGMNYLAERLIQTDGEIGHAFAGYNGGHAAAASNWNSWANETQRYYKWTTGVYSDALNGNRRSETLEQWITAGGASLCAQAEQRLGLQ